MISFENLISLMCKWAHQRRYATILLNFARALWLTQHQTQGTAKWAPIFRGNEWVVSLYLLPTLSVRTQDLLRGWKSIPNSWFFAWWLVWVYRWLGKKSPKIPWGETSEKRIFQNGRLNFGEIDKINLLGWLCLLFMPNNAFNCLWMIILDIWWP